MTLMENFRDFNAGPDPFGRTWHAMFKYLQVGISIRHSDSIDVCYVLDNGEERLQKIIVIQHADLREYSKRTGRKISDTWCSRLAMLRLQHSIETAEDLEKDYIGITANEIAEFDAKIQQWETDWVRSHAA